MPPLRESGAPLIRNGFAVFIRCVMQLASRGERVAGRARAGYSCYMFPCVQYSVDLHDIVLMWPVRRSPTELRVQPTPDDRKLC